MAAQTSDVDFDVVIVGHGPVGQTAAALFADRGMSVAVVERHVESFRYPRAVHCDDQIVRILQSLGVADEFVRNCSTVLEYVWFGVDGEPILRVDWGSEGRSGWVQDHFFYQPRLEDLLQQVGARSDQVEVLRGWEAEDFSVDPDDGVSVTARNRSSGETRTLRGRYLIGADGANSRVREMLGTLWDDLGFRAHWLVADVRPNDPDARYPMHDSAQICDSARPTTLLRWIGRDHCRFEFMIRPGEQLEDFENEARCWKLISRWGPTPDDAELVRSSVYEFRSLVARRWMDAHRRVFLIGDAAHQMPPFLGQGMCAGMRDAMNLAWKLDLVRRDVASVEILDSYEIERRPHVTAVTRQSMALGRVACVSDPGEAQARDAAFRAGNVPPPEPFPGLLGGIVMRDQNGQLGLGAGEMSPQAIVQDGDDRGLFDDVVQRGWVVLSRGAVPAEMLNEDQRDLLDCLGARIVHVTPADKPGAVVDAEHRYQRWFQELDVELVIVRPDFYVFGGVRTVDQLPQLVDALGGQLMAATPLRSPKRDLV